MNLQAISSAVHTAMLSEIQKAAPAAVASSSSAGKSSPAGPAPNDTVSLSPAAQAGIAGGDVDHDGDSH
jgi:type II secretory pathway component PulM